MLSNRGASSYGGIGFALGSSALFFMASLFFKRSEFPIFVVIIRMISLISIAMGALLAASGLLFPQNMSDVSEKIIDCFENNEYEKKLMQLLLEMKELFHMMNLYLSNVNDERNIDTIVKIITAGYKAQVSVDLNPRATR
jgi:hypothetical protein